MILLVFGPYIEGEMTGRGQYGQTNKAVDSISHGQSLKRYSHPVYKHVHTARCMPSCLSLSLSLSLSPSLPPSLPPSPPPLTHAHIHPYSCTRQPDLPLYKGWTQNTHIKESSVYKLSLLPQQNPRGMPTIHGLGIGYVTFTTCTCIHRLHKGRA